MSFFIFSLFLLGALSTSGVDVSNDTCRRMTQEDWDCLHRAGKDFAVIQVWRGGHGFTEDVGKCVRMAYDAGFKHVDLYIFMCPNCRGNSDPERVIDEIYERTRGIGYGMMWLDVEQCSGCWGSKRDNCEYVRRAASRLDDLGVNYGMYSSNYEWGITVGTCRYFTDRPLWYAHYDNRKTFSDYRRLAFGGWDEPAIKQYAGDKTLCGVPVDLDWY